MSIQDQMDRAQARYDNLTPYDEEPREMSSREEHYQDLLEQIRKDRLEKMYRTQDCIPDTWTCCGGIELDVDEKCSICGEMYDD